MLNNRRYSFILLLLLTVSYTFSQSPAGVKGNAIWVKGSDSDRSETINKVPNIFNFNPVFYSKDIKNLHFKNVLKNKFSLFVVFKSSKQEEDTIVGLNGNIKISNKQILGSKSMSYKKVDAKNGIVLSYLVSSEEKINKRSNFLYVDNLSDPNQTSEGRNDLMELIYYPRVLTSLEKQKVESYLSIKYGISLLGEVNYIDSKANKIWDFKSNKDYNFNVTGIGRDDGFMLNQKQSGNAKKEGLYIGLKNIEYINVLNKNSFADQTFLLWGSNGNSTVFKGDKKNDSYKKMARVWKVQTSGNDPKQSIPTQIVLNKDELGLLSSNQNKKAKESVWLVVNPNAGAEFDYQNAEYYKQSSEDETKISFDNIEWDLDRSGSDLFTFVKAPDFFVVYDIISRNCNTSENAKINAKIVGGQKPYTVQLKSDLQNNNYETDDDTVEFSDLIDGDYVITITDDLAQWQKNTMPVALFKDIPVTLNKNWYLDNAEEVLVIPQIEKSGIETLTYEWTYGENIVSTESQYKTSKEGDYSLFITNSKGCFEELKFKVSKNPETQTSEWVVYPNPVKIDQPFSIRFLLKKESSVSVSIFDFANKLIKSNTLGTVKETNYSTSLSAPGAYLLIVTIDGKSESAKFIVN